MKSQSGFSLAMPSQPFKGIRRSRQEARCQENVEEDLNEASKNRLQFPGILNKYMIISNNHFAVIIPYLGNVHIHGPLFKKRLPLHLRIVESDKLYLKTTSCTSCSSCTWKLQVDHGLYWQVYKGIERTPSRQRARHKEKQKTQGRMGWTVLNKENHSLSLYLQCQIFWNDIIHSL